jgi:DNA polymerase-4
MGLFAAPPSRATRLNAALDRIADRFGGTAVSTADVAVTHDARDDKPRGRG